MPPEPPKRKPSSPRLSVTEEVAPNAVHEYRPRPSNPPPAELPLPPPSYRREPVEDNPPMARPRARQPSRPEAVEVEDADDRPSVIEFKQAVHVQHGKLRIVVPWVVVAAVITALSTYYGAAHVQAQTPPNDQVLEKLAKLEAKIDARNTLQDVDSKLMVARVGALESKVGAVDATTTQILMNLRGQK